MQTAPLLRDGPYLRPMALVGGSQALSRRIIAARPALHRLVHAQALDEARWQLKRSFPSCEHMVYGWVQGCGQRTGEWHGVVIGGVGDIVPRGREEPEGGENAPGQN